MTDPPSTYELLVVDDSAVYRKLVEQVFAEQPYYLSFASTAEEGMKLFNQRSPSFVITDWMLPDFSGFELCQRIRKDSTRPYCWVIVMTSNQQKGHVVQALQAGADDYLTKPFDPAEMLARVGVGRRIIDLHRELAAKTQRMEEAARTDPLTGLPNRRAIEEWALKQMRGADRHGFPLWVVLGDLDNFKQINDTFGHDAGDIVLKTFADLLKRNTRASDICGRLGGDEFILVITHVEPGNIAATINRFRETFSALSFPLHGKSVRVTASFGVAGLLNDHEVADFGTLLQKADKMLYEAKRSGRNLVQVS
ncbi:MAG TPA: diguanylate cyclase [Candidatus Saccharimonadales bacterium]|nr:diguanylate cyclase [Candidatus Saccharimonadales bacterium]